MRTEDPGLLTGANRYVADLRLERPLHAVFVRSEVAHGLIDSIDVSEAAGMPGVVAIWTAAELGIAPHHGYTRIDADFARPPLATDRVRFVGEAVAVVFAESPQQGVDAAQAVWVDIEALPAVTDPEAALAAGAPVLFPDRGDNIAVAVALDAPVDLAAVSDVVVRGRYVNQRIAVAAIEPNGCAAAPAAGGRLTVWPSNQFPHHVQRGIASRLQRPRDDIHVVTLDLSKAFVDFLRAASVTVG